MRLIDADELIKRIGEWMPQGPGEIKQTVEERVATDMATSMYMEIEETPTAFDKEKVINEIRSGVMAATDEYIETCDEYYHGMQEAHKNDLKIVEKGGIE